MGLSHSPKIATSGLVFALDAVNYKSYKGPAIQNVASTIVASTGSGTGYAISNATETYNIPGLGSTSVITTTIQNNYTSYTPNSNQCCPNLASWSNITVLPSTLYTYGIVYRCDSGYTSANYMYRYEYTGSGGTYVTEAGVHSESRRVHLGDGWYYAWGTFTTQSTTNFLAFCGAFYYRYSQTSDRLSIAKVMIANGDYSGMHPKYWPAQASTRSNTQALLDLAGTNTITANSLTYNADGAFSFASTSNYASVGYNSEIDLVNTVTLEAWLKYTTSTNTVCIEKSSNNTHYQFQIFASNQGSGIGGDIVFMLQPNTSNWVTAGLALNDNQWHHVVGTYDRTTTTARIYVDGVLRNTNNAITTGPTTNTQPLLIGSRSGASGFGGTIPVVKIYNRVLSATEVLQNFNALRGRYGI